MPRTSTLDNEIRLLVKTGKVVLGSKRSLDAIKLGKAKGVVLASKLPRYIEEDVLYYAKISGVKVIRFPGSSHDLGATIGKPFPVATIAILDPGESSLLEAGE